MERERNPGHEERDLEAASLIADPAIYLQRAISTSTPG